MSSITIRTTRMVIAVVVKLVCMNVARNTVRLTKTKNENVKRNTAKLTKIKYENVTRNATKLTKIKYENVKENVKENAVTPIPCLDWSTTYAAEYNML